MLAPSESLARIQLHASGFLFLFFYDSQGYNVALTYMDRGHQFLITRNTKIPKGSDSGV
jgi:hypothetical protein